MRRARPTAPPPPTPAAALPASLYACALLGVRAAGVVAPIAAAATTAAASGAMKIHEMTCCLWAAAKLELRAEGVADLFAERCAAAAGRFDARDAASAFWVRTAAPARPRAAPSPPPPPPTLRRARGRPPPAWA
jgi:hypothetical protein